MSYTREQAEEVLKDFNTYPNSRHYEELSPENIDFLNHKFGVKFEVGKWYRSPTFKSAILYQGELHGCIGMFNGEWATSWSIEDFYIQMTEGEVIDFISNEFLKRYKKGTFAKDLWTDELCGDLKTGELKIVQTSESIYFAYGGFCFLNLITGEWAEVIKKDPVLEQIQKIEKDLETLKNKYNEKH